jgi:hypothetical protein
MEDEITKKQELEDNDNSNELSVRLTGRDKELLAHVAVARYLTLQQLRRLVFTSRSVSRATEEKNRQGRRKGSVNDVSPNSLAERRHI